MWGRGIIPSSSFLLETTLLSGHICCAVPYAALPAEVCSELPQAANTEQQSFLAAAIVIQAVVQAAR